MPISPDAQRIVDRLAAVDVANPVIDRQRAENALREHFERLGLEPLPVRWCTDAEIGVRAAWSAAESAAWSAARSAAESAHPAIDRYVGIWLPFVDAYEAGLWLFWMLEREVVAVPRPVLRVEDDRLHCDDGPAVSWPAGAHYWFWRGVQVPQAVVEAPETLDSRAIFLEANVEVRRVMLERFGADRFLRESDAQLVSQDDYGRLWRAHLPGDEALVMVEVDDPSTERTYFLRVPPTSRTPRGAIAWTFDVPSKDYRPLVET